MFVDASALVSVLAAEIDGADLSDRIEAAAPQCRNSPLAVFETAVAMARIREVRPGYAVEVISEYLERARIDVVPIEPIDAISAIQAFETYGKGAGHPARLNMGDCFSYAMAKRLGAPLLYKGEDFIHTDLA